MATSVTTSRWEAEFGNKLVGGGVWERRIDFEKGYRLYYAKDGDELVLPFCGGTKSRQQSDIDEAKQYWTDYKRRKRQGKTDDKAEAKPQRTKSTRRKK